MPVTVRIGVIAAGTAFNDWRQVNRLSNDSLWHMTSLLDIRAMREENWFVNSIICLPGWRHLRDADAVLSGALTLVIRAPDNRESANTPAVDENEPVASISPPAPTGSLERHSNINWLLTNTALPGMALDTFRFASDSQLSELRLLVSQRDAAAGRSDMPMFYRWADRVNRLWNVIRDRQNPYRTDVASPEEHTISAPPRPVAVADVLRGPMRELSEQLGAQMERDTPTRRRRRAV